MNVGDILDVVRKNYDSLTLKLQDSLDQYERYAEKPRHAAFFTAMHLELCVCVADVNQNHYFVDLTTHTERRLQCCDLPLQDIRRFHEAFYSNKDKVSQDNFILQYTVQHNPKRRRPSEKEGPEKGSDVPIHDWKSSVADVIKAPGQLHFKFSPTKRITLKKTKNKNIVMKGEINYRVDTGTFKPFLKKGKSIHSINPEPLPSQVPVKAEKIEDVKKLLNKHFGEGWDEQDGMDYYRQVLLYSTESEVEDFYEAEIPLPEDCEDLRI
uniref:Armadillo-like helical domain-containing protein n=1 Tax=Timema shepardi TaxID=629360 RepID=A0A7R9ANT8_TIMSH|nr:unnamed protein product [Timema shepardi]